MDGKIIRVGMDISQLAHGGGVAVYTENLTEQLNKISDLEMTYFYSSFRKPYKDRLRNVKKYKLPPSLFEIVFNKVRNITIEKFLGPIDVFHSSDWVQPRSKAKKVTTYHDLIPLKFPKWSDPKIVAVHKRRLKLVEQEVDMVICVSNSTKRDLLEMSKIPQEKIAVIYEGVNDKFKPLSSDEILQFKKEMGLPEKYILAISGIGERRNLKRVKEASKDYHLIISGVDLPYLPSSKLPSLYSSASLLLYPSLYEGFGLPILEAMACGTPVIISNVSSMPEVGGEAALYVDPTNVDEIKRGVKEVMENESLREALIKEGFEQAKKFFWKKCANETAEVYRRLMK